MTDLPHPSDPVVDENRLITPVWYRALDGFVSKLTTTAVASLPSAAANTGRSFMVSDANDTTFWSVVAAGGTNVIKVTSDGADWRIG